MPDLLVYCSDLPGLIDMLVSTVYSVLFLSAGASLLSWGSCKQDALCLSWNGTVGVCFFLFIVYLITAVCAALDLRAQIQALKGVPPGMQAGETVIESIDSKALCTHDGYCVCIDCAALLGVQDSCGVQCDIINMKDFHE